MQDHLESQLGYHLDDVWRCGHLQHPRDEPHEVFAIAFTQELALKHQVMVVLPHLFVVLNTVACLELLVWDLADHLLAHV